MPTLPSSLALETIDDGSQIVASEHRNNYTAIQQRVNDLLGILDDGVAGQVLKGSGTTVSYDYPPGYEIGYTQFTGNVSVTATSEGTAQDVVSSGAITYDGTAVLIEFYAAVVEPGSSGSLTLVLQDGAAVVGIIGFVQAGAAEIQDVPVCVARRLTPSAGSHTYKVTAFRGTANGTIYAGAGGSATYLPGFIRVTKI